MAAHQGAPRGRVQIRQRFVPERHRTCAALQTGVILHVASFVFEM
jgi:hypothetical protein